MDLTFGHHWTWDILRLILAFTGGWIVAVAVMQFITQRRYKLGCYQIASGVAFAAIGAVTAIQEVEAIGEDVVLWRLGLLLVGSVAALVAFMSRPSIS